MEPKAMRLPRMTTRRWMVLIAVVAVDLTLIVQRASHPLATIVFFGYVGGRCSLARNAPTLDPQCRRLKARISVLWC